MSKFHEEAVELFAETQAGAGNPATVTAAHGMAVLELSYSDDTSSSSHKYVGDDLSRDEETVIEDETGNITCKTFMPVSGVAGTEPPATKWLEACGGATIITAGTSIEITNSAASSELLTMQFRRSSSDIATQKNYQLENAQGVVNLEEEVGKRSMLEFTFNGNPIVPDQQAKLVSDTSTQKSLVAPLLRMNNLTLAELVVIEDGDVKTDVTNICYNKLSAPNVFGFAYDRFLTGCEEGFSKGAVATDVTITILEDDADATYNPHEHKGKIHAFYRKFGNDAGKQNLLTMDKLQLVEITPTTVGKWVGQELKFRNRGTTSILLT